MALVKHRSSKNALYGSVLEYYTFKHVESQKTGHYEPILDENGLKIERENYAVTYITAAGEERAPEEWSAACVRTNMIFQKNGQEGDVKNHEYIISHPAEDRALMKTEDLMNEGKEFAKEHLQGYDVLIAVHRDTDNDHIHISINSVRALEREHDEEWMKRDKTGKILPCELEAGGKHQDSVQLRMAMNQWLMEYTRLHGYAIEDNNTKAQENRAKRHGTKNDQMRDALLEAAARSRDVKDLQSILKKDYRMDLKIRGGTFSVQYPNSAKAVRLKTLDLEPADLTRLMKGPEFTYTKATEDRQIQKEIEAEEQKKYIEWIRDRRQRNNEKAEHSIMRGEEALAQSVKERGERYNREDFGDLLYLIRQTTYIYGDLETEKEKVDRLLERWDQYKDVSLHEQERRKHAGYVRWCGCDPDSDLEYADLKAEREIIVAQQANVSCLREELDTQREQWKGHNEIERRIERADREIEYTKERKRQLKNRLKDVRANRKKLWDIYYNCRRAADKYGRYDLADKAKYYKGLWHEKVQKELEIQKKIRDVKKQQKEAKASKREAKRQSKLEQSR